MRVIFFHRKPRPNFNFSVENLFTDVRNAMDPSVKFVVRQAKFFSDGIFKRVLIGIDAMFHQGEVNHVTGDINFLALFLQRRKTVLTMLDLGLLNRPNSIYRSFLKLFWVTLPARHARIVTTISEATKTELLKHVKIDPQKVKVVYVPISAKFKRKSKSFNKVKPKILQIGTGPNKNVSRLVKALAGIPCTLDIVGRVSDALEAELLASNIEYTASMNLSNEQIVAKYEEADIVSFVSTYEGFGMPIVEANAIGRVVITSNLLSMPEVGGNAAHFVDPFDVDSIRSGIERIIADDSYRDQLISNGFENHKRFDVRLIARQYTDIYRTIIQANR